MTTKNIKIELTTDQQQVIRDATGVHLKQLIIECNPNTKEVKFKGFMIDRPEASDSKFIEKTLLAQPAMVHEDDD